MRIFKIFVIACVLLSSSLALFAATGDDWKIYKTNGEEHGTEPNIWVGYWVVDQNPTTKTLECRDPGACRCNFTLVGTGAGYTDHLNHMMDEADNQILNNGVTQGSYNENFYNPDDNNNYYCTITWVATIDPLTGEYDIDMDIFVNLCE